MPNESELNARSAVVAAFEHLSRRVASIGLGPTSLAVETVGTGDAVFAAVDAQGYLAVAIVTEPSQDPVPSVRLANLEADYGVECELVSSHQQRVLEVSVVKCTSSERAVRQLFSSFVSSLLEEIQPAPSQRAVAGILEGWMNLFWRLLQPSRAEVVGLIGELVVIAAVKNPSAWVDAWHTSPLDLIDFRFTNPALDVEVKATTGRERIHTITLHQSILSNGGAKYFGSVFVELRETGTSLGEFIDQLAERLDSLEIRKQFWAKIADSCGRELEEFRSVRFMADDSKATIAFFAAERIPRPVVALPLPVGVSGVTFRSDFSSIEPMRAVEVLGRG